MNTHIPRSPRFAASLAAMTIAALLPLQSHAAEIFQSATGNWNNTIWGDPAELPTVGNTYVSDGSIVATLSTSNSGSGESFAGDSLTLRNGVVFTASRNVTGNFILESGAVFRAANRTINVTATSTVMVAEGESVYFDSTNRTFTFAGTLNGSGHITVRGTSGSTIIANAANTFNGNWAVESGTLDIQYDFSSSLSSLTITGGQFNLGTGLNHTFGSVTIAGANLSSGTYAYSDLTPTFQAYFIDNGGTISVIPEPSTYALLAGAGMLVLAGVRRRKTRA